MDPDIRDPNGWLRCPACAHLEERARIEPLSLRPYQQAAVEAAMQARGPALVAMPTGSGKTVVFAELARRVPGRVLIVAHRRELIDQAARTVYRQLGERAATWATGDARIRVLTIQALQRRMDRLPRPELLVIDEAHHSTAATYRRVINWASGAKLVGVTATPYRADEDREDVWRLGHIWGERPVYTYPLEDAIRDGYLVPIRQWAVHTDVDLSGAHVRAGDLVQEALQQVDTDRRNMMVAEAYDELCEGRRAICYAVSVEHAYHLSAAMQARDIRADVVHGRMTTEARETVLRRHRRGELDVVVNVGILTEGYDDPRVAAILMARPTRSRVLYAQCVGRGLRPPPPRRQGRQSWRKSDCIVVDFVDRAGRHDIALQSAVRLAGVPGDIPASQLDARGRDIREAAQQILVDMRAEAERLRRYAEVYPVQWVARDRTPRWSREALSLAGYHPAAQWHHKPATTKQLSLIRRFGWDVDPNRCAPPPGDSRSMRPRTSLSRGEAAHIIDRLLTLDRMYPEEATEKQIRFLRWKRIPFEEGMTKHEATRLIAQWKTHRR